MLRQLNMNTWELFKLANEQVLMTVKSQSGYNSCPAANDTPKNLWLRLPRNLVQPLSDQLAFGQMHGSLAAMQHASLMHDALCYRHDALHDMHYPAGVLLPHSMQAPCMGAQQAAQARGRCQLPQAHT